MNSRAKNASAWGLTETPTGELAIGPLSFVAMARQYGTPLLVMNEDRLHTTATAFRRATEALYPGPTAVHYPLKTNGVPGVVRVLHEEVKLI